MTPAAKAFWIVAAVAAFVIVACIQGCAHTTTLRLPPPQIEDADPNRK